MVWFFLSSTKSVAYAGGSMVYPTLSLSSATERACLYQMFSQLC